MKTRYEIETIVTNVDKKIIDKENKEEISIDDAIIRTLNIVEELKKELIGK
jgi:hypothetical protein